MKTKKEILSRHTAGKKNIVSTSQTPQFDHRDCSDHLQLVIFSHSISTQNTSSDLSRCPLQEHPSFK